MRIPRFPFAFLLGVLLPQVAAAGVRRWTTSGPEGAQVLSLATVPGHPGRLLAGTSYGGLFDSSDMGMHWRYAGLADLSVRALAADSDGARLYAGTDAGFFRSGDGGLSWESRNSGLPGFPIESIAVDPQQLTTVYAAAKEVTWIGFHGGLFRSNDSGETWSPTGLTGGVSSVLVDPERANVLYALTSVRYYSLALKSSDGGATWTEALGVATAQGSVTALFLDPRDSQIVYAGVSGSFGGRVYKSTDGGSIWSALGSDLGSGEIRALFVSPMESAVIYAATDTGLFRSSDAGNSWERVLEAKKGALAFDRELTVTYAGGSDGVSASDDGGATWRNSKSGLVATEILDLLIHPGSGALYSRTRPELFRSLDHGETWQFIDFLPAGVSGFALDPLNPAIRYAGIVDAGRCRGVSKSLDGGGSWNPTPLTIGCIGRFVFDPHDAATLYAVGQFGLWKSTDAGASWIDAFRDAVTALAINPARPSTVYAGTSQNGVFRSDDGGTTWRAINVGIPDARSTCSSDGTQCRKRTITSFALDPRNPDTISAGTLDPGVLRGVTVSGVAVGLSKSTDGGETWREVGRGIAGSAAPVLALDPTDPEKIYVGTDRGVFRSVDAGESFFGFSDGLTHLRVYFLQIEPSGRFLHAGTLSGGVFDIELPPDRPQLSRVARPSAAPRLVQRPDAP